jgi:3-phosphoshikimate 1-carboxyvinyltransferase
MCLAAFLPGRWFLNGVPENDDVATLGAALREVGAGVEARRGRMVVTTVDSLNLARLDLGANGTALRILSVLLPMLGRSAQLNGTPGLTRRPMDAALDFLSRYGAAVEAESWPWSVGGELVRWPLELHVNGQTTSQVASGVLLGAALRVAGGWDVLPEPRSVYVHQPVSKGYLDVTARVLHDFGFDVTRQHKGDGVLYQVHEWRPPEEREDQEVDIPADPSSLCFPLALAQVHGVSWQPPIRGDTDPHPDWDFDLYLKKLRAAKDGDEVDIVGLRDHPDCFPALSVLAAARRGKTRFVGIRTLRGKESDRIHAMAAGLAAAGLPTEELEDGVIVQGPVAQLAQPRAIPTTEDHRVVMALSLLGTMLDAGIVLGNEGCVAKSWPGYFDWLGRVAQVEAAD